MSGKVVYNRPKEIADELVYNLMAAKQLNLGIFTLRQVAFSKFDRKIHSPASHDEIEAADISELYNSLLEAMIGLQWPEYRLRRLSGYATTSHYVRGKEANYYSYLYSVLFLPLINENVLILGRSTRILVADIWDTHFQTAPMSRDAGLRYRKLILDHGGSQDEWTSLTAFLGRDPDTQAYLRYIKAASGKGKDGLKE